MAVERPKVYRNPLELLDNSTTRTPTVLSKIWGPAVCGTMCFVGVVFTNFLIKRPMFSGIQRLVGITAAGAVFGKYADDFRNSYFADRDAILRHYVTLHPEDFPDFEAQKFGDLLLPWVPIR